MRFPIGLVNSFVKVSVMRLCKYARSIWVDNYRVDELNKNQIENEYNIEPKFISFLEE